METKQNKWVSKNIEKDGKQMNNKEKILEATIKVFNRKGLKFTMDDIASELSMSKKTIYTVLREKE